MAVLLSLAAVACNNGESSAADKIAYNAVASNDSVAGLGNGWMAEDSKATLKTESREEPGNQQKDGTPPPLQAKPQAKTPDKVIKTGNLTIDVDDYDKSRGQVQELVRKNQGYISHEDEYSNNYSKQTVMTIRVPAAAFDIVMDGIAGAAKTVRNRTVNVADVSEEYYDVEARKNAQKAAEQRYIELLKQARTVGEVMEVQAKIDQIQEEVEGKEARLRVINDQVAYSTITLTLAKNYEYVQEDRPGFWGRMGNAFSAGWHGLQWFFIGLAGLWPLWIIAAVVFWIVRRSIRRYRNRKVS